MYFIESHTLSQDLGCLLLRDTLDLLKNASRGVSNRLDSIVTAIYDQLNVPLGQTCNTLKYDMSGATLQYDESIIPPMRIVALARLALPYRYHQLRIGTARPLLKSS